MSLQKKAAAAGDGGLGLIVGQVLEATRAASEGLRVLTTEARGNAEALLVAAQTLRRVEGLVAELDEVVRVGGDRPALTHLVDDHHHALESLRRQCAELERKLADLDKAVDGTEFQRHVLLTRGQIIVGLLGLLASTVTAVVAIAFQLLRVPH